MQYSKYELPENHEDIVKRIRKAYTEQGASVSTITYEGTNDYSPYYTVCFAIAGHACSIRCPIETEGGKFYHIQDIWNTGVNCTVKIDKKVWYGLDVPDYYGVDIEDMFDTLEDIIEDIYSCDDHYEIKRNKVYQSFAQLYDEDLSKLGLEGHKDFDKLVGLANQLIALSNKRKDVQNG